MSRPVVTSGYESLASVLDEALEQAQNGKGKERHSSRGRTFEEQPIVAICDLLGSNQGDLFQAIKKAQESVRLKPGAAIHELLGAINYLAAAVIQLKHEEAKEVHGPMPPPEPESDYDRRNNDLHRLARLAGKI